jgi:hypothetical protein
MNVITKGKQTKVFGGLLGNNYGNKIEICYAFEILADGEEEFVFNHRFMEERKTAVEKSFPNYQILGFFATNNDLKLEGYHTEMAKFIESFGVNKPLFLILSTELDNVEILPVKIYEYDNNKLTHVEHTLESSDSERIGLETVSRNMNSENKDSSVIQNMVILKNAISVLKSNLSLIKESIKDDPSMIIMLDEMVKNYPNVDNKELFELLMNAEKETLLLNNIASASISLAYLGKIDALSHGNLNDNY